MQLRRLQVYPTPRIVIALAVGCVFFFAMAWEGKTFLWLGLTYDLLLLALATVDYSWLQDSRECTVTRDTISVLSNGQFNPIWIEVLHRGRRPMDVIVKDEPPIEFEFTSETLTLHIQPDESERANYKVRPSERGDYRFGDITVRYTSLLGLMMREERIPAEQAVKVYPDIFQTKKLQLLSKEHRATQMGLRRSKLHGQGQEFERLRDYMPDDTMRHVDWKATARRSILTAREFDLEKSQNILILIDLGRTMASRTADESGKLGMTKADCAINASVLLTHVAAESDDRVGLFCFANGPIAYVPPGKGKTQSARLMDALYPLKPRPEESAYYESLAFISHKQQKRSMVFVFTDLIDPASSGRLISSIGLLTKKHLVICIALADYELPSIIDTEPVSQADMYIQATALTIIRDRKKALSQLAQMGVITIDATPSDLSVATVNKYLQLKREARL
jgi:uncharacterized protein (DUF58 family)